MKFPDESVWVVFPPVIVTVTPAKGLLLERSVTVPMIVDIAVPVKGMLTLLPLAATVRLAVLAPLSVGVKVRFKVHFSPAARVGVRLAQGVTPPVAILNSVAFAPVTELEVIASGELPELYKVIFFAFDTAPTLTEVKPVEP